MSTIQDIFETDSIKAVSEAVRTNNPLIVLVTKDNTTPKFVTDQSAEILKSHYVCLKVEEHSKDFSNFKQLVSNALPNHTYVLKNQKLHIIPQDKDMFLSSIRKLAGIPDTPEKATTKVSPQVQEQDCMLSLRLLDGTTLQHTFKSSNTLNDVRNWLDLESNVEIIAQSSVPSFANPDSTLPSHYTFQGPVVPRITYDDALEFKTLKELNLCPRSVLILKPLYSEAISEAYAQRSNVIHSVGEKLTRFANALYSFFDYNLDEENEEDITSLEDEDNHGPPSILSFENGKKAPVTGEQKLGTDDKSADATNANTTDSLTTQSSHEQLMTALRGRNSMTKVQTELRSEEENTKSKEIVDEY